MKQPQQSYVYESELSYFWFDENDFLCVRTKNATRTYEKQKTAIELIKSMMGPQNACMLLDMRESGLILYDEKSRAYISRVFPLIFKAVAVIAETTLQKVAPTILLNTGGMSIPIRIFDTEREAREWLKQYA